MPTLRSRAEARLRRASREPPGRPPRRGVEASHELQVHQIELEMQNEQLRLTQGQLEAAREEYAELYDYAPLGYLTVDPRSRILAANFTSTRLLGLARADLVSVPLSRFIAQEDRDAFYLWLRRVFRSSETQVCEVRLRPAGGALRWARLEAVRAMPKTKPACWLTLSDITGQREAAEALREREQERLRLLSENEERLRLALEAGELGAWDHHLQTGKITCSARVCSLLGLPAAAPVDWARVVACIHPEDRPGFQRSIDRCLAVGGTHRCDATFRIVRADGTVRWARLAASTFVEAGRPPRAVRQTGVLADITASVRIQEQLQSQAVRLEELVRERTARLQEVISDLEHFSYTLAHDLRAPLRTVASYAALLLEECASLTPAQKSYLERGKSAVQRMDGLILEALNYSRIARGDFALAPVEPVAQLKALIESYPQFREAAASLSVQEPIPAVWGNPALLTQCLSNLLDNALKFVPPGRTPAVRVFAEDKGSRVRLWIEDNGIGIDPADQKKVFGMFQRLSANYEGTGIGLALVKKAAERMRGAVGVESQAGQGSRFWLDLDKAPASA